MKFLDEIVAATRIRVAEAKRVANAQQLEQLALAHEPRGFRRSLENAAQHGVAVIAELKKASPSRGVIRQEFQVGAIAQQYEQAGAAALSVLTEEKYFLGSLAFLREASESTRLPCLRKDFILDEFQLIEARANRADAVLLIIAMLTDSELRSLHKAARGLSLDVLCEVHEESELQRAVAAGCEIIGVNSRDLRTFQVDLETAVQLGKKMPEDVLRVAESGIHDGNDVDRLRAAGYHAFLIGESLMRAEAPGEALKALIRTGKPVGSGF
ncbi:MAG TPA: indole-3-glycerol phosphate synthase TrpC [Terriglobales bacterium]|nr:indole-3-glycerol phosphate synthase TrpC [Terriglobales bacterium]